MKRPSATTGRASKLLEIGPEGRRPSARFEDRKGQYSPGNVNAFAHLGVEVKLSSCVIVVGLGEIGRPLMRILAGSFDAEGVDLAPREIPRQCSVLHICYPFQIHDFVGETAKYIHKYQPALTIINSTVVPGTTRRVHEASGKVPLVYSPVRGKHAKMEQDLLRYQKFVAGCDRQSAEAAVSHFTAAGFRTAVFSTPEIAEVSKLLETTYLGVLVGWAQEVERIAGRFGATFDEVNSFIKEIDFLPSNTFPGFIGGHCVMPNIEILRAVIESKFLTCIVESNETKQRDLQRLHGQEHHAGTGGHS